MAPTNAERLASIETLLKTVVKQQDEYRKDVKALNGRVRKLEIAGASLDKLGSIGYKIILVIVAILSIINTVATWAR